MKWARLTEAQVASIPEALVRHGGNKHAVARELGTSHETIRLWVKKIGVPPRLKASEGQLARLAELASRPDLGETDRETALSIGKRVASVALKKENWDLLLRAGMLISKVADGKSTAYRSAVIYLDQRQVNLGAIDPKSTIAAWLDALESIHAEGVITDDQFREILERCKRVAPA